MKFTNACGIATTYWVYGQGGTAGWFLAWYTYIIKLWILWINVILFKLNWGTYNFLQTKIQIIFDYQETCVSRKRKNLFVSCVKTFFLDSITRILLALWIGICIKILIVFQKLPYYNNNKSKQKKNNLCHVFVCFINFYLFPSHQVSDLF